ncbi:LacI family DNA-binding transcriptional regulator [Gorillibacterium sp. CAU 1737]|uniref:LacI family DNA-binding transcriptional regulator n=1 Tax=Gorillibacterium sp. CAU 1737 TaxID=3140362 RepID=UPI003260B17F
MAVTIIDVAKKAGVSPSTVSRVITGSSRISPQTTERIRTIMDELGYVPNSIAKSLVSKTTNSIGLVLPKPAEELFLNHFFSELIRGILTQCSRAEIDLMMTTGATEREEVDAVSRLVRGRKVDGILLLYSRKEDPTIEFLQKQDFPFVLVGRSNYETPIYTVDTDNKQAAFDATRHLIDQGHQRIGFVSGPPNLVISEDRKEGYLKALESAGLPLRPEWILEGDFLQESGYRAMSIIMSQPERPTAFVVIDDMVAFGVLRGLTELGVRVPQDISLVGFNNIAVTELTSPPLTSIDIGIYELGYTASQLLHKIVKGEPASQNRLIIPHRLIVRESSLFRVN